MATRILIVQPDPALRAVLAQSLEAMKFDTTTAQSGREALAALVTDPMLQAPIHGVLLDLELHGLDALTVLREIHARHPTVRVIAITADRDPGKVAQALTDGAAGVLQKPVDMHVFQRSCRAVFSFRVDGQ